MVNDTKTKHICNTCANNDICKYKEDVENFESAYYVNGRPIPVCLDIKFSCQYHTQTNIGGNLKG